MQIAKWLLSTATKPQLIIHFLRDTGTLNLIVSFQLILCITVLLEVSEVT